MLRSLRYYRRNDRAHSFTVDQTFNNMFSKKYIKKKKRRRKGKKRQKKKKTDYKIYISIVPSRKGDTQA